MNNNVLSVSHFKVYNICVCYVNNNQSYVKVSFLYILKLFRMRAILIIDRQLYECSPL